MTLFKNHVDNLEFEKDISTFRKRALFHKYIPDLNIVKQITGERFTILQDIFNYYDPIADLDIEEFPNKYELLTRTVIYKLPIQENKERIAEMLLFEISLWFRHYKSDFDRKDELIDAVYKFTMCHLLEDPF